MERARVFIVEDDIFAARDMESVLRRFGYDISGTAHSAETAMKEIILSPPDLILMDIKLGGTVDGIQAADEIFRRFDIPVIFLSAFSDAFTVQRAAASRPYGYLLKPFISKELYTTIEMALYRHATDKQVREREHQLRSIMEAMPVMVSQTDGKGLFTYVNAFHAQALGYTVDELIGIPYERSVHPDDSERVAAGMDEARAQGKRSSYEFRCRQRSGRYVSLESDCACIRNADGETTGFVFTARDITAQHNADERIRRKREQLTGFIGSATDAIITTVEASGIVPSNATTDLVFDHSSGIAPSNATTDPLFDHSSGIVLFNAAAEVLFDCPATKALGRPLRNFLPGQRSFGHKRLGGSFDSNADNFYLLAGTTIAMRGARASGEMIDVEASISAFESNHEWYTTIILRDITERTRAEHALRLSEERYRLLMMQLPAQVWTTDHTLHFTSTQGLGFEAIGVDPHQLDGLSIQEFFNTDNLHFTPIAAHRRALLGESVNYDMTIAGRTFQAHVEPLRDAQRNVTGTLCVAFDFTERKHAEDELLKERTLLRTIIEAIPDEIYVKDTQGRIILANQTSIRVCGASSISELLGKTDTEIFGTPSAAQTLRDELRLIASGIPLLNVEKSNNSAQTIRNELGLSASSLPLLSVETTSDRKHIRAHERSFLASTYPFYDAHGAIVGLVGINRDITDQRRSTEQMRRANLVIEHTDTIIIILRRAHHLPVEYVSTTISLFGYRPDEFTSGAISFLSIIHLDDRPIVLDTLDTIPHNAMHRRHNDFRILCKSGEIRWVNSRMTILRDTQDGITHYEGILQDITERKRAEHALQLTQFSVDHASDAVFWINNEGAFMYVNRAACTQLGYTRDELLSLSIADIDPRTSIEQLWQRWRLCEQQAESSFAAEVTALTKSGKEIPAEITINRMEFGEVEYFFVSARNIAVRKKAETALRVSMTNALKFSALAAHELRTPLAVMRSQLESSLTPDIGYKKLRKTIASIYDDMLNLTNVVGDLLNLSTMQAGTFTLKPTRTSLHFVIRDFYDEALLLAWARKITIVLEQCPEAFVSADVPRFRQVLFNLLDNALKHSPAHSCIRIGYTVDDSTVQIHFVDTGNGIPAEKVANIFDAYYRAGDALYTTDGVGLGLTLVKWIVELHGGTIAVQSTQGEGTSFFITLPLNARAIGNDKEASS